jgi:YtkA-like
MKVGYLFDHRIRRKISAFSVVALVSLVAACASAKSPDYRFDVVDQPVAVGAHSEFDVRLTEVSTGQPVSNATISTSALEMTHYRPSAKGAPPAGVRTPMAGDVKFIGPAGPGLYRFMGDVSMPGTWELAVSANVPGESEPVEGTATFEAGR